MEDLWRRSAPRALAALLRRYGDFDASEDAVQEALLAASRQWPDEGVPEDPTAWLITVASRRLIDGWRSDRARARREEQTARSDAPVHTAAREGVWPAADEPPPVDDSVLLLLLCCHPSLPRPAQVALTLRAVGGLTTAQIARGFLVPEATMAQRITRAKAQLRQLDQPFRTPAPVELPQRVEAVTQVLYLIFTEGHSSTAGGGLYDISLTDEAIRLSRELHRRLPAVPEVSGLLALMLLTDARRPARTDDAGRLIPLAEQDRTRWDWTRAQEGIRLIEQALPVGRVGPLQLQAAIAAVHAEARTSRETDWAQIEVLYQMLAAVAPSPVVTLNHAVALAMVEGPQAGLERLEPLLADRQLRRSHRLFAVRAHLLELDGQLAAARLDYATAARLATSIPEQRYLNAAVARLAAATA
ncbi:RNA polymerase sigma factor, sigma-70 family [Frankineae bacterium MT45]|nr:RNA polymerase sigma factor, sigma-70 family [Frankineae bacterium MT45]